jgi:hypothetical protein
MKHGVKWLMPTLITKKALEIYPNNSFLISETIRLADYLGHTEELTQLMKRYPKVSQASSNPKTANLVIFYEGGLAPRKQQQKLTFPIAGQLSSIAYPTYDSNYQKGGHLKVFNGTYLGETEEICDVHSLAVKALLEKKPIQVARQIVRLITKGVMTKVMQRKAGLMGTLAGSIYGTVSEKADLRSWLMLPDNIQIAKLQVPTGSQKIILKHPGLGFHKTLDLAFEPGRTVFLQVIHYEGETFVNTIYI